ncbi:ferrous iron transport protein B [Sporolactobacillus shoreae]|uniref:Ferrous iron transport protein B n=1 Tax=Sporolactobacillus shoreae TaxID=1465501 RepID=A0A4Z0GJL5_9BACL|nr:ferrous iron transport protein B [Sporolactobacillus shoreae]TGA96194.1 ferrous iron transport protein B [Sporolactobacillus shoreae]
MEFALFGNPNTGKTSLFNLLTGSYAFVGNWTGVTVEKKIGRLKDNLGTLVDLPGLYAMSPLSKDESVATTFLLENDFSAMINIIDASQLARNLQLTIELLEFGKPAVIALNMLDVAKHRGISIDDQKLSELLNVPVLPVVARSGRGCHAVMETMAHLKDVKKSYFSLDYGFDIEKAIGSLESIMPDVKMNKRWLAIQYLEGNQVVVDFVRLSADSLEAARIAERLNRTFAGRSRSITAAEWIHHVRKRYINRILAKVVNKKEEASSSISTKIDAFVTNRFLGIPLFFGVMYLIFHATFNWIGNPFSNILDAFFSGPLTDWTRTVLEWMGVVPFIRDVILNGIIAGVGGVIVFVPQIFVLFFFISWIEDSGYMARVALVMDRLMQAVGLNGKAFIPLVIGFGCNIPGVMAARTIEQPKERLLTVLISPLMSCSARLTVYSLFAGVFFAKYQALVVLSLYFLSIVMAMIMAKIFSMFMKKEKSVFVIEMPPYRIPNLQTILQSTWDKAKGFVKKATTFILGGTIFVWLLSYTGPGGVNVDIQQSFLALACSSIAPIVAPLGFGTWQAASALVTGFLAKESVVSTLGIIYHASGDGSLNESIRQAFTPLQAYSFMVFTLLYIPCMSTVPAIKHEVGTAKLTLFTIGYCVILAYLISFIFYRTGLLLGF